MATEQLSAEQENNDEQLQWATFELAGELYGVNVMQVKEVLRLSEIAPVPGAQHYILGIINLRGNVIPVVDTRTLFGIARADANTDDSRIIVIELEDQTVGMLVDSVAEVIYLKQSQVERAPNVGTEESTKFIQGVSYHDESLIILLDLNRMIDDDSSGEP
ncbi:chemotaxis protein CheW [Motiliproteus sp. SC1-56]|uniref:chemotaxis protein CheW n=1 Tax=Motiliproteus sp. SC1-56 TaxID=2799565 RepID=UPI001A8E06AF|nr:chemotaxis protein CheW [Motiliproteus sp. SC1-56]